MQPDSDAESYKEFTICKKRPTGCIISATLYEEVSMPTKNPRVNVVLEKPLYANIERLAKRDGVSLSLKVRDLVREALEMEEDIALAQFADSRDKTFSRKKSLKHDEVW